MTAGYQARIVRGYHPLNENLPFFGRYKFFTPLRLLFLHFCGRMEETHQGERYELA